MATPPRKDRSSQNEGGRTGGCTCWSFLKQSWREPSVCFVLFRLVSKVNLLVRMEVAQGEVGPGRESLLLPRGGWRRRQGCSLPLTLTLNKQTRSKTRLARRTGVLLRVWTEPREAADAGPGLRGETSPRMPFPSPRFRFSITGSFQLATVAVFIPGKQVTNIRELVVKQLERLPRWLRGKESACQCRRHRRCGFDPWVGNTLREGNDNPLQYSCLGNPMDRGAWWATIHGVAESDATEHACRWVGVPTSQSDGT